MSSVKRNVYDLLRGSFLTDAAAFKNWRIIIFVVALLLFMISSAHNADGKVMEIAALNKKKRELRAAYVDAGTLLMQLKMESNIREKVKQRGILPSKMSPQKIKIIKKNNLENN
jgi:hypothetical protein